MNDEYSENFTEFSAEDDFTENSSPDTSFEIPDSFEEDTLPDFSEDISPEIDDFSEDIDYEDGLDDITDPDPYDVPDSFEEDITSDQDDTFSEDVSTDIEDFPEDSDYEDGLDDITDPDPYDVPDSFEEDIAEDVELQQDEYQQDVQQEMFSEDSDTYDTLSEESSEVSDSIPEDERLDVTGDISEPVSEPIHMTQSDIEWYMENANDPESLRQMRDGIASGRIQVDADTDLSSDDSGGETSGPVLRRNPNEQWEIGNNAINDTIEVMRDDLRDKGMEDGPEMESIVMTERARMQDELARNINGDFSNPYQKPDFSELMQSEMPDILPQDIPSVDQASDAVEVTDVVSDVPQDIDYDAVYSGLDNYDFDGIDYSSDVDRLDSSLENFQNGTWENLSVDEQKAAMSDLSDYVKDVIGFDNPPQIVYYNNPVDGDYGGYSPETNTLEVNEHMLYDNNEAADTIAHELWHAYQHERAMNPQSAKDYQYQYGFENYIRPDDDFTAYQDQLVEAEARAFAQQFKDRLSTKRRSI